ncbi:MAG: TIR domain-containing protein [Acidobacteria bacterium]|nr:TIR domain-containing protein [Acidobacteriota bacterium]
MNRIEPLRPDAVRRAAAALASHLGLTDRERLTRITDLLDADGQADVDKLLAALWPTDNRERGLAYFRQFRQRISAAAGDARLRLELKADRGGGPAYFQGEDQAELAVRQNTEAQTHRLGHVVPQDGYQPQVTLFVSYARDDKGLREELLRLMDPMLKQLPHVRVFGDWLIPPGVNFEKEILNELNESHLGLLLLSEHFFKSDFIDQHELPHFRDGHKRFFPVLIDKHPFSNDLKGLKETQIFRHPDRLSFREGSADQRSAYAQALFDHIFGVVRNYRRAEDILRDGLPKPGPFIEPRGAETDLDKTGPLPAAADRVNAMKFIRSWLDDPGSPRYFALFGEYGIGKTTTCLELSRRLHDSRSRLPIYCDLRSVSQLAKYNPAITLEDILHECGRLWQTGELRQTVTPAEILYLVRQQDALLIFDGLDEVLVHLDEKAGLRFTRELMSALPPARWRDCKGRLLFACRTHFFRTFRDQCTAFTLEDRDRVRKQDYKALVLLPFDDSQIRGYLRHSIPDRDPDSIIALFESVHDLRQLAERPYTLSLMTQDLPTIEQWKADGRNVTGVMVYRHVLEACLERDQGKHQLAPQHKMLAMQHLAAELWRSGQRAWTVDQAERWLVGFLREDPDLAYEYQGKIAQVKEDLRTATFLVREGADQFRFAHTSLLEFFLASYLARGLRAGRMERWNLPRPSVETLDFIGQMMLESREPVPDGPASVAYAAYAIPSHQKGYPAPVMRGWNLEGADLAGWEFHGLADKPLDVTGIRLAGANLQNTTWRWCVADGADLLSVKADFSEWRDCRLERTVWSGAELYGGVFRQCAIDDADYTGAALGGAQFLLCGSNPTVPRIPAIRRAPSPVPANRPIVARGHTDSVSCCAWSPDGKRLASASLDNTLRIWDPSNARSLASLHGHSASVSSCAWAPDGKRLASASLDNTLRIWDPSNARSLTSLKGHSDSVWSCAWAPDGTRLASASDDNTLRLWDPSNGRPLASLHGHSASVSSCAWAPDGTRLASASADNTLRIWDPSSGRSLASLHGHSDSVRSCAWAPDGKRLASASYDKTLRIWDPSNGRSLASLHGHSDSVRSCAWAPDGKRLASASYDKTLRIWDPSNARSLASLQGHSDSVWSCAWAPDGKRLASASADNTLRIWDPSNARSLASLHGHSLSVLSCAWAPDGKRLASASDDQTLRIWDPSNGRSLASLHGHSAYVRSCAWAPDGKLLASASRDKTVRIWDPSNARFLTSLKGHSNLVNSCAWSPDGKRLASASHDNTLRVWDPSNGRSLASLHGHSASVSSCAWAPEGKRLASASLDNTLRIWDPSNARSLASLHGHSAYVLSCAWAPDGKRVASASADNTLRIWDPSNARSLASLHGHSAYVSSCAWAPDGKRLASASADNTLRIWDTESGQCLTVLTGHEDTVTSVHWHANWIVSASTDGSLRIWDAGTGRCLRTLQAFFNDEWASIDEENQKILACSPEAWRDLAWSTGDGDWIPAEAPGPLPVFYGSGRD